MIQLTVAQQKYIAEFIVRWKQVGVTHVMVTTVDHDVCGNCYDTDMNIMRLTDLSKHYEQCTCQEGCRCSFYPLPTDSDSRLPVEQSLQALVPSYG